MTLRHITARGPSCGARVCDDEFLRYDLSLFAAEDEGRTEQPSERKKKRAREEEGRVVNSVEVNQTLVLAACIAIITLLLPYYVTIIKDYMLTTIGSLSKVDTNLSPHSFGTLFSGMGTIIFKMLLPIMVAAFVVAVLSNLAQTRFLFTTKNIKIDFGRIAPNWKNFKQRVFFSRQSMMNFVKILFKVAVLSVITTTTIVENYRALISTLSLPPAQSMLLLGHIVLAMLVKVMIFLLIIAVADYIFQYREYMQNLKMTKSEVKQEMKELDGDPHVKGRIREMMQRMAYRNMYKSIPEADVVVTNPTHFAVALKYEASAMQAPQVVAKGADHVAQRIKDIARANGIEVVENRELARHLFYHVEINEYIPEQLYNVVSFILAKVYRMREERVGMRRVS
ncbi:MAG: flagellar biosynthesis protein FlhB [Spirochaetes bacterium]|nr:flagellar biosynthesis protein FlhB [Spirochaetota bacterium]